MKTGPAHRIAVVAGICLAAETAVAMFAVPELTDVPVERLAENLQRKIQEQPAVAAWRYALGRLFSIAYATASETAQTPARASQFPPASPGEPYFHPGLEPWRVDLRSRPAGSIPADAWLAQAIEAYEQALALEPSHTYSLMGLAWCYEQAGRRDDALRAYREAHTQAWPLEAAATDIYFAQSLVVESGEALLRLLPDDARAERDIVASHLRTIKQKPFVITPIVIPVAQDTRLEALIDRGRSGGVWFDLVGGGQPAGWEWITPSAAWLVWDPRETGRVTSGRQLFGSTTWWIFWADGYQPLSLLDDDGDGWLAGRELLGLSVWRDADRDGLSRPGEVVPLRSAGITQLACQPDGRIGQVLLRHDGARVNGRFVPTYDWFPRRLQPSGIASARSGLPVRGLAGWLSRWLGPLSSLPSIGLP